MKSRLSALLLALPAASCGLAPRLGVVRLALRDPDGILPRGFTITDGDRILTAQEQSTFELSEASPLALFAHHTTTGEQDLLQLRYSTLFAANGEPKVPASQLLRFETMHFVETKHTLHAPVPLLHGEVYATLLYEGTEVEATNGRAHFVQSLVLSLSSGGAPPQAAASPLVAVSPEVAAAALMPPVLTTEDAATEVSAPRIDRRAREEQLAREKGRDLGDPWHVKFERVEGERFEVSVRSTVRYQDSMVLSATGGGGAGAGGRRATRRLATMRGVRKRPSAARKKLRLGGPLGRRGEAETLVSRVGLH